MVHTGFLQQYESVREKIHEEVERLVKEHNCQRILCTGHSLFGAIATLAALDCSFKYDIPIWCVSFGSPRVGGRDFVKSFNRNVDVAYRCVLRKDPITFTPLPIRFKHVRGWLNFGKTLSKTNKNLYNCCGCKVSDHSMELYKNYIGDIVENM